MAKRRILTLAIIVFIGGCITFWLAYRQSILSIIGIERYILFYVDGGVIHSPQGYTEFNITYFDAGATHSGPFWTIISKNDWLKGRRIIAEGYSSYPVRYGQQGFPIEWANERQFWVTFIDYYSGSTNKILVNLN